VKVHVVDPPAYTPPYDHALSAALGAEGLDVELVTSAFRHGAVPAALGYTRRDLFPATRAGRLAGHVPAMLRYRAHAREADVVHFQWLTIPGLDRRLLPRGRPLVITAHDVLPRERIAGSHTAQRRLLQAFDAVIVHSQPGRARLIEDAGIAPERIHIVPHGAFTHLAELPPGPLPGELHDDGRPVVLHFGLIRPYKGLEVLLEAWAGIEGAQLWIVGRPRYDVSMLAATPNTDWVPRFVSDSELAACFARADLVVLPYRDIDQSGVLATALAFAKPLLLTEVGGFAEIAAHGAAMLVPPSDPDALHEAIVTLLADPKRRSALGAAAGELTAHDASFARAATLTKAVYAAILT
jgi:glycosyltransferase involved in cell wall biosynthesis